MLSGERNSFTYDGWVLEPLSDCSLAKGFDCGDPDLNEFFLRDVVFHEIELLTKTYCLTPIEARLEQGNLAVALISFCNDAIRLKDIRDSIELPEPKRYPQLPAVKIARLGVSKDYTGRGIGTFLINMVKRFFVTDNRTGCRVITVDAYNRLDVIRFYERSYFSFVTDKDRNRQTRAMFYDLKTTEQP